MDSTEAQRDTTVQATAAPAALVDIPYRTKVLLVAALTVTLFVATMNQTVVATAAQNIVADIGGFDLFAWLFAGFSLAAAIFVPVAGKLSDVVGRKPVLMISLVVFLGASAVCGAAQSMPQLIVFRVFQGIGFAGVMGSVWIIMAALWKPEDRAKWLGVTAAGFTLSGVLGPVIGGVVSDAFTWRWVFYLNLPVGGLAFFLLYAWFPSMPRPQRTTRLDIAGAFLFAATAGSALLAFTLGGQQFAWSHPAILGLLAAGVIALGVFIRVERRAQDPMLPLSLFRHRVFTFGMLSSLSITTAFIVVTVFEPLFVIGVLNRSATAAAGPLMAMAIGVAVGANIAGQLLSRIGRPREIAAFGMGLSSVGLFAMSTFGAGTGLVALAGVTFVLGFGVSFGFTSFTVPVQNAMPANLLGVVTSTLQFSRMFGMAFGSAAFGAILLAQVAASAPAGPAEDPRVRIHDPEVIVSETRLGQVREEYMAAPELGAEAYRADLARSRDLLSDALRVVFIVSGLVSGSGVLMALFAFSRAGPAQRRREAPAGG